MKTVLRSRFLLVPLSALILGACGGEEPDTAQQATPTAPQQATPTATAAASGPNGIDMGFAAEMVPHHEEAIAMAKLAEKRARHPEIKRLAADIIESQQREVRVLQPAFERLLQAGLQSEALGIAHEKMGMGNDMVALERSRPFDRAFIDAMVPHHQGAIRMARVELAKGGDKKLKALARDIVDAQSREIRQMNAWRTEWYRKPSPAGGIPPVGEDLSEKGHAEESEAGQPPATDDGQTPHSDDGDAH